MLIEVVYVEVNKAGTGRSQYEVAEVTYSTNGNKRSFKVMSFANPQVFKVISQAKSGDKFNVTVGKNDRGYDAWNAIEAASAEAKNSSSNSGTTVPKFAGDRESKDEREAKQRYIIRQSSLSNAIQVLTTGAKAAPKYEEVTDLAEKFVKFVYEAVPDTAAFDLFNSPNDLDDIPL